MQYDLKHSGKNSELLDKMIRKNGGVTANINRRPELLDESLDFYLKAFFELESERPISQYSVVAIPITKIIEYGKYLTITDDEMENFILIIRSLDNVIMQHYNKKSK